MVNLKLDNWKKRAKAKFSYVDMNTIDNMMMLWQELTFKLEFFVKEKNEIEINNIFSEFIIYLNQEENHEDPINDPSTAALIGFYKHIMDVENIEKYLASNISREQFIGLKDIFLSKNNLEVFESILTEHYS